MQRYAQASSNLFITVGNKSLTFNYSYKNLTTYSLYWNLDYTGEDPAETRPSITIWEPEDQAGTTYFTGTQEEYNEWIQPLITLFEQEEARLEQIEQDKLKDQVLQANLALERYDANINVYQKRIGIALANGDTELVTELQNEMNSLDPASATQDTSDIRHYCKKCGHDLDAYNICTNENCKRKQMQDNIVQLVEEQETEQAQETITSET